MPQLASAIHWEAHRGERRCKWWSPAWLGSSSNRAKVQTTWRFLEIFWYIFKKKTIWTDFVYFRYIWYILRYICSYLDWLSDVIYVCYCLSACPYVYQSACLSACMYIYTQTPVFMYLFFAAECSCAGTYAA